MIGLLQRVREAQVTVGEKVIGRIDAGLLVLLGVERGDGIAQAERLLERVCGYRIFEDEVGRMNRSLAEHGGGLLVVPQFTLAADTRKGMRPSFTPAASPEDGAHWFGWFVEAARERLPGPVAAGRFGADMRVSLTNEGPVTFWLRAAPDDSAG